MTRLIRYLWPAPATTVGLALALLALTRGRLRIVNGVVEAHGPLLDWALARAIPLPGGAAAVTFGHVVLGKDAQQLEATRAHERIHVRQYERWGPFFLPAYVGASLWALVRGRHFYFDNRFEREAIDRAAATPRTRSAGLVVVLALLGACAAGALAPAGSAPQAATQAIPRVVVLGDSLAVSPSRASGFPAHLQARIDRNGLTAQVVNAGVRGDTTARALARVDAVLADDARVVVIAVGANDALRGVPVSGVRANLAGIVARATRRNVRVLLCGMEAPPVHGWEYSVAFHRMFPSLAGDYDVPLVPFLLAGVALNPEMNGRDGIHPNEAGARRIADTIWPYLEPLIRELGTSSLSNPSHLSHLSNPSNPSNLLNLSHLSHLSNPSNLSDLWNPSSGPRRVNGSRSLPS